MVNISSSLTLEHKLSPLSVTSKSIMQHLFHKGLNITPLNDTYRMNLTGGKMKKLFHFLVPHTVGSPRACISVRILLDWCAPDINHTGRVHYGTIFLIFNSLSFAILGTDIHISIAMRYCVLSRYGINFAIRRLHVGIFTKMVLWNGSYNRIE